MRIAILIQRRVKSRTYARHGDRRSPILLALLPTDQLRTVQAEREEAVVVGVAGGQRRIGAAEGYDVVAGGNSQVQRDRLLAVFGLELEGGGLVPIEGDIEGAR